VRLSAASRGVAQIEENIEEESALAVRLVPLHNQAKGADEEKEVHCEEEEWQQAQCKRR
jgi:hypothetical protein